MQLLSISKRICVVDSELAVNKQSLQTVERELTALPPGIYIAIASIDSVPCGLVLLSREKGIDILGLENREPCLPTLPREIKLPVIEKAGIAEITPAPKTNQRQRKYIKAVELPFSRPRGVA